MQKKLKRAHWQDSESFKISPKRKMELEEASEAAVEYCFVISVTVFNRCDAGKVDDDDEEDEDVDVRKMLWLLNLFHVFRISVPIGN
jgi:hypothetical protein